MATFTFWETNFSNLFTGIMWAMKNAKKVQGYCTFWKVMFPTFFKVLKGYK